MTSMNQPKRALFILVVCAASVLVLPSWAQAQQLSVAAVQVTMAASQDGGNTVQATFSINIASNEDSPLTSVNVEFKDGGPVVAVDDVPAHGNSTSQSQTITVDLTQASSVNIPIPVTVRYWINGAAVEFPTAIVLTKPQ